MENKEQKTIGEKFKWIKGKKPIQLLDIPINASIPYLSASYLRTLKPDFYVRREDKNYVPVNNNDVVLIWDGSNAGDVFYGLSGSLSSTMVKFNETPDIDPMFLYYLLKYNFKKLNNQTTGSTIPHVNGSVLKNIKILTDNLQEQKEIVRILMSAQQAIDSQMELIAKFKKLKKNIIQHLFTHGANGENTKITEIGEIPESWNLVNLDGVCEKPTYGFTDSASKKGNVKFLRITDIKEDGVDWSRVPFCNCPNPEKYLLKDGDIVFARIGATTGKSYLIKNPDNAVYASYLIRVRVRDMQSGFLQNYFQTEAYWKQIDAQKGTSLKGGVNGSILSKLHVPLCSNEEQIKIVETIEAIDNKILLAQKKLEIYQNLFKTLLHEIMSGERRVNIK